MAKLIKQDNIEYEQLRGIEKAAVLVNYLGKDSIKVLAEINEWVFSLKPIIEELRSEVKPFYETQLSCSFEGRDFNDVRILDPNSIFIKLR